NREWERLQSVSEDELRGQTLKFRAIIKERTESLENEIERLRQEKRTAESTAERESLSEQIGDLEKQLYNVLQDTLNELLPEAYATVKEAARRLVGSEVQVTGQTLVWDMVPYDVQLMGAIALHEGKVAE